MHDRGQGTHGALKRRRSLLSAILAAAEVRIRWWDCCWHHYASRSDADFPIVELLRNTQERPDNEPRRLPPTGGMCNVQDSLAPSYSEGQE